MGRWREAFLSEVADDPFFSLRANRAISANRDQHQHNAPPIGSIGTNGMKVERERKGASPHLSALLALTARREEEQSVHVRGEQDMLDDFEERAAIAEFEAHLSRAEAERQARAEVYGLSGAAAHRRL